MNTAGIRKLTRHPDVAPEILVRISVAKIQGRIEFVYVNTRDGKEPGHRLFRSGFFGSFIPFGQSGLQFLYQFAVKHRMPSPSMLGR
jgi:hypothetical protein